MRESSFATRWLAIDRPNGRRLEIAARTAGAIGVTMVGLGTALLLLGPLAVGMPLRRSLGGAACVALGGLVVWLARSERPRTAALLCVLGSFFVVTGAAASVGGVMAPAALGYFSVVTIAALTLGGRAGIATGLASVGAVYVLGRASTPAPTIDAEAYALSYAMVLLMVTLSVTFAQRLLDSALREVEHNEREIEQRNRALEAERRRFDVIADSSRDLISETRVTGEILYASPNHEEVLGWTPEELVREGWDQLLRPEGLGGSPTRLAEITHGGEVPTTLFRGHRRDGSIVWLETAGRRFSTGEGDDRIVSVTRDVTERVDLETQLRQAQKLEALGRLAGGVAHDFNNLLTVINGYSEILCADERFADEPSLQEIHAAGERAQVLTRQLLSFSRHDSASPSIVEVGDALRGIESLLLGLLGERITLSYRHADQPLHVFVDPGELEQVIVNLAVNARDAMPDGGRISVSTRTERAGDDGGDGDWAVIEVADQGVGMTDEVLTRIFEPFFTTKEVGEGTGLGLSTVHGIVDQSGGRVSVESVPGEGTRFQVRLPLAQPATAAESSAARQRPPAAGKRETILLVEDEPAVRNMVRSILESQGYELLEASNGREALKIFEDCDQGVDLLLTDVVMPEMSGWALRSKLAQRRPEMPAIFMSGYPDRDQGEEAHHPLPGDRSIRKPFSQGDLFDTVREVLDGSQSATGPQG